MIQDLSVKEVTDDAKQNLLKQLKEVCPEAAIHQVFRPLPEDDLPPPLHIIASNVKDANHNATNEELLLSFFDALSFNDNQLKEIEKATRSQSQSFQWKSQRRGRITSSRFHDVYTKVNSLKASKGQIKPKTLPLITSLLSPPNLDHVYAVQYGKKHECDARQAFASSEVSKHVSGKMCESGVVVPKGHPYLGASPDNVLSCKCCGKVTVEYKCPYLLKTKKMSVQEGHKFLDFLVNKEGKLQINQKHKYYTQVIGQMALLGCKKAYFVVWSEIGPLFVDTVHFNREYWERVLRNLVLFYKLHFTPALLGISQGDSHLTSNKPCHTEKEV